MDLPDVNAPRRGRADPAGVGGPVSRAWIALFAALALAWFANTGVRSLTEPDEGRYAEVPREMLATGEWGVPRLDGIQYLEKPPLQYWGTAALYTLFGPRAWVSRLWTTGLGFGCVLLVLWTGRRLYGVAAGLDAALVLAASPLFFGVGHINTLDMGLTFFLTAAMSGLICAQRSAPGSAAARRAMWLTWLAIALAALQKGIVALAMPGFALVLYSLAARDFALWRRLHLVAGLALVLALNLPWWVFMSRHNPDFLQFFFVHEHFQRFATNEHQRTEPWWYFSVILVAGFLPWLGPVLRGVMSGWKIDAPARVSPTPPPAMVTSFRTERFLVVWAAAVFIFYSPSGSKLAPYILPMFPPLALLAGRHLASGAPRVLRSTLAVAAVLTLVLLCAAPLVPHLMAPGPKRDTFMAVGVWISRGGAVLGLVTLTAAWIARRVGLQPAMAVLGLGLVTTLAVITTGTNALERWRGGPYLATSVAPYLHASTPLYCVGMYPQTLTFALQRTCQVVGYFGELEIHFDGGERQYIPTYEAFVARWRSSVDGVAVVDPPAWTILQAQGIPATIVAREPTAIVIVRSADPPSRNPG